jgi:hypothetical protein
VERKGALGERCSGTKGPGEVALGLCCGCLGSAASMATASGSSANGAIDHRDRRIGYDRRHYRGHYGRYQGSLLRAICLLWSVLRSLCGSILRNNQCGRDQINKGRLPRRAPFYLCRAVETSCAKWKGSNRKCPRELERSLHGHGLWVRCS